MLQSVLKKTKPRSFAINNRNQMISKKSLNPLQEKEKSPNTEEKSESLAKKLSYVTPTLYEHVRKTTTTCVSLNIDLNSISWSKFRLNYTKDFSQLKFIEVEDWSSYEIPEYKRLNLSELINIIIYVNKKIPDGDVYVMESLPSAQQAKQPGNPIQVNVNVQRSQFVAMASTLLANRSSNLVDEFEDLNEKDDDTSIHLAKKHKITQNVFFMRQFLASRLFRIYIGNEKVSTENAVENLLRYNYNYSDNAAPDSNLSVTNEQNLHVPDQFREVYQHSNRIKREYLGQSFLIGMTFIRLCLLKCSKSMQQLNKRGGGSSS